MSLSKRPRSSGYQVLINYCIWFAVLFIVSGLLYVKMQTIPRVCTAEDAVVSVIIGTAHGLLYHRITTWVKGFWSEPGFFYVGGGVLIHGLVFGKFMGNEWIIGGFLFLIMSGMAVTYFEVSADRSAPSEQRSS